MAVQYSALVLIFIVIASSIFGIASSSIAIQAYNENPGYMPYGNPDFRKNNFIYLWVSIGVSILALFTSFVVIKLGGTSCPDRLPIQL